MKKLILITIVLCWAIKVFAQEGKYSEPRTIAGGQKHFGAFGAINFKSSKFNDEYVTLTGLKGGVIINRSVALGIEFNGVIPCTSYKNISNIGEAYAVGGYGGLFIEPVFFSNHLIHFTLPVSAGAGWMGYIEDYENDERDQWDEDDDLIDGDTFWYIEPGITAEANVTKWFRIAAGYSRRFTQDMELTNTSSQAFSTNNYSLTLKFGRF